MIHKFQSWDSVALETMSDRISRKVLTGEKAMVAQVFLKKGAEALEKVVRAGPSATQGATNFQAAHTCLFTMNVHQKEPNSHEYEELYEDPILRERRSTRLDRPAVWSNAARA